ncbi:MULTISPECIES: tetratricopeptide repeat protein [unclassified Pseudoalteromonas]|uniref:tetratricopeptide repeat protein n=1 Tax=unclassified Pseudoalteromonas TaxID=194690 RepID=UPI00069508B3|nr:MULTISPECIES: sel1 repeat family protein [unclassified Pseudoalteromonas]
MDNIEIDSAKLENSQLDNSEIDSIEIDNPELDSPELDNPELDNPEIDSPELDNPELDNPELDNPELDNPELDNPELDSPELDNTELDSPEIDSSEIDSSEIDSSEIDSPEIDSSEIDSSEIDSPELDSPELNSPELDSPELDSSELDNSAIANTKIDTTEILATEETTDKNQAALKELTLFELEEQLLNTFSKLIDIIDSNHKTLTSPAKLQPSKEQLFATSIHMAKSKNDVGAAKWMRRAAISGHVKAQYYLGLMFAKGNGLPQSEYHAVTWLTLAESQGMIEAVEAKGKLQRLLCAKQIKDAQTQAANLYEQIQDEEYKFYIESQNKSE